MTVRHGVGDVFPHQTARKGCERLVRAREVETKSPFQRDARGPRATGGRRGVERAILLVFPSAFSRVHLILLVIILILVRVIRQKLLLRLLQL